jgi:hypothetical protein
LECDKTGAIAGVPGPVAPRSPPWPASLAGSRMKRAALLVASSLLLVVGCGRVDPPGSEAAPLDEQPSTSAESSSAARVAPAVDRELESGIELPEGRAAMPVAPASVASSSAPASRSLDPNSFGAGDPRVIVQVLAADGCPRVPARNCFLDATARADGSVGEELYCIEYGRGAARAGPHWREQGALETYFRIEPGKIYLCGFVSDTLGAVERKIVVGSSEFESRVDLVLPEVAELARLEVDVQDPSGAPLTRANQVVILSRTSRHVLWRSERNHEGSRFIRCLPAGSYRLLVTAEDAVPECGNGWEPKTAPFGPFEQNIHLSPRDTTRVEARLSAGGRIRLKLDVPKGRGDERVQALLATPETGFGEECAKLLALGEQGPGALVTLTPRAGGVAIPLRFFLPRTTGLGACTRLIPGTESVTETMIAPGEYVLRVTAPGYAAVEAPVEVAVDAVVPLTLELEPIARRSR